MNKLRGGKPCYCVTRAKEEYEEIKEYVFPAIEETLEMIEEEETALKTIILKNMRQTPQLEENDISPAAVKINGATKTLAQTDTDNKADQLFGTRGSRGTTSNPRQTQKI